MWRLILCSLCILNLSKLSNQSSNDSMSDGVYEVEFNMIQHKIVPDLINDPPKDKLHVLYQHGIKLTLGNIIRPFALKEAPVVSWRLLDHSLYFTLLMVCPDIPSRSNPHLRHWQHWLVVNMPGNQVKQGETLTEYVGPGPLPKTGFHRYVFLLYAQSSKMPFNEIRIDKELADGVLSLVRSVSVLNKINRANTTKVVTITSCRTFGKYHSSLGSYEQTVTHLRIINEQEFRTTSENRGNFSVKNFVEKYNLGTPIAANFFRSIYVNDNFLPKMFVDIGTH